MKLKMSEAAVVAAAALAVLAAIVAAAGSTRWALAVVCFALGLGLLGLARIGQLTLRRLAQLQASAQRTAKVVGRLDRARQRTGPVLRDAARDSARAARISSRASTRLAELESGVTRGQDEIILVARQNLARADDILRGARLDSHRFRTSLDTLPSDTVRLLRTTERLMPGTADFPGLGDWALTPGTLLTMLADLGSRSGPVTVVECGSGTSTLFFALALQQRGDGSRVVALESDLDFAAETRAHLARAGVDHLAQVVDAPLVEQEIEPGERRLWFDASAMPELDGIDLLFVDGPVGGTSREARYPALPYFAARLRDGATVMLDDTDRPDEVEILARWTNAEHAGRRVEIKRRNVRSTLLRVVLDDTTQG